MTLLAFATAAAALSPLAISDLWSDPKQMGLAVLIFVAALFLGVVVSRLVPRDKGPTLFGTMAALAFVAALAYFGVEAAGYLLWVFLAGTVLLGLFALVTG